MLFPTVVHVECRLLSQKAYSKANEDSKANENAAIWSRPFVESFSSADSVRQVVSRQCLTAYNSVGQLVCRQCLQPFRQCSCAGGPRAAQAMLHLDKKQFVYKFAARVEKVNWHPNTICILFVCTRRRVHERFVRKAESVSEHKSWTLGIAQLNPRSVTLDGDLR